MAGSYERRVNCSWEAIAIPQYVSHYFSCRIIPNPGLDMGRDGLIDNRHMILAYDTSDFAVTVSPPGYSGKFQNGTYYLPPGIHTPGVHMYARAIFLHKLIGPNLWAQKGLGAHNGTMVK